MTLILSQDQSFNFKSLITQLVELNYSKVAMVLDRGQFSVRGDVVDIFSANHLLPIRLEFDLDIIIRIAFFSVHTQKTHELISEVIIAVFDSDVVSKTSLVSQEYIEKSIVSDQMISERMLSASSMNIRHTSPLRWTVPETR